SGCGKSKLLRIITGLQKPSEGKVLYRGEPLRGVNPHATIVFQTFALFPWLNVFENVDLALKARDIPADVRKPRALKPPILVSFTAGCVKRSALPALWRSSQSCSVLTSRFPLWMF
ncbi:MAG TPA: ATP-binding cassette domain-containing protein, partial [Anaerolineales bacterium]|nr:ATP-binding cassette domain-containing protein [Anaerolineales bacterium]